MALHQLPEQQKDGHDAIVHFLLEKGADVNATDYANKNAA